MVGQLKNAKEEINCSWRLTTTPVTLVFNNETFTVVEKNIFEYSMHLWYFVLSLQAQLF